MGFEDNEYFSWYILSPCRILWWRIVPMTLSIQCGWLCGGLIYSFNLTMSMWKSELILHSANFQRHRSAGVGCWVGNLWTSECPGWSIRISALIVFPSHRTISDLWITVLCMCMMFKKIRLDQLKSPVHMNSDIKDISPQRTTFNWKAALTA